jgi:8-oxo-dGTP pyrophosphatase MutT (NUDIX family)
VYRSLPRKARRWVVRGIAPKYTVGAMCLIERSDGRILLVRQAYRKSWGVPGGLLQRREDPEAAVRREVLEEVGLELELIGEPTLVVECVPQRVDVVYRGRPARDADLDLVRPCSVEIREVGWFAPDGLPDLQEEASAAMIAMARASHSPQSPSLLPAPSLSDRRSAS